MRKQLYTAALISLFFASCSNDDNGDSVVENPSTEVPTLVEEAVLYPTLGGPNEQNQVYIDLSTSNQTAVQRDTWDLGFSTGSDFRVIINGSIKMAVKQLNTTDITAVQTEDSAVSVGFSTPASLGYVDNPTGILQGAGSGVGTAIAEISSIEADNKVYLVNMGYEVSTTVPSTGSVSMDGDARVCQVYIEPDTL